VGPHPYRTAGERTTLPRSRIDGESVALGLVLFVVGAAGVAGGLGRSPLELVGGSVMVVLACVTLFEAWRQARRP
jgi:hypothetical protein